MSGRRRRGTQPPVASRQLRAGGNHPTKQPGHQEGGAVPPPTTAAAAAITPEPLHGRVRARVRAWAEAGASADVVSWIADGYRLPWARAPPQPFNMGTSCRRADAAQRAFLATEVERLTSIGAIKPAICHKYVSRAFLVPKPGQKGKWRLIIDLRPVNRHLRHLSCRYETLRRLCRMARKGDWCLSLDLQDGFYAVGIAERDQRYLTFTLDGIGSFSFTALPMGLSASPYVFTKVMRTFVRALRAPLAPTEVATVQPLARAPGSPGARRRVAHLVRDAPPCRLISDLVGEHEKVMRVGLRVLPYMDDFLFLCATREVAEAAKPYIDAVLGVLGLSRHPTKGAWDTPVQQLQHLGLGVDTALGIFYVTPERLDKLRSAGRALLCRAARERGLVPARQLAAFTGLAQSLYLALPAARHYLRSLHDAVATCEGRWARLVRLTSAARSDLQWFTDLPTRANGREIWRSPATALLHSDASLEGWGGVLNMRLPARGFWLPHQRRHHITVLELKAVRLLVETFGERLRGRHAVLREDNQAVVALLRTWTSRSPVLQKELRKLLLLLDDLNVTLDARYIRSAENWWADALSRTEDREDYQLDRAVFARLQRRWPPCTVDRFASASNALLPMFNSAWAAPGCAGVDAFAQGDWTRHVNWCNPPWSELDRLAQHLRETGAAATVIAPYWPAQPWFQAFQELAADALVIPARSGLFVPGRRTLDAPFTPPRWPVIAFQIPARG